MSKFYFLDLFSGAGGLSEGFIQAGFKPIAHVEIDRNACKTLRTRLIYHHLKKYQKTENYYNYLSGNIDFEELVRPIRKKPAIINCGISEKNNEHIFRLVDSSLGKKTIDLVVGGPPCQAYSLVGRSRDKNGMKDDPRNYLYKDYARFLKNYYPKVFVFENVVGLITANNGRYLKNMLSYFKRIGYNVSYEVINSKDFGVLQDRKRVIIIGWRKNMKFEYPDFKRLKSKATTSDLFLDLKSIRPGEPNNISRYTTSPNKYLEESKIRNGVEIVSQHYARPHNKRDLEIYRIAIDKYLDHEERLRYCDLPEKLKTHKNQKSFLDRYKVVNPYGISHTMVAHISKDGHYYIYPDKKQVRSISIREAARIQSFPDNYFFEGSRTSAYRQIGNAVPPLMSKLIAKQIKKQLCQIY